MVRKLDKTHLDEIQSLRDSFSQNRNQLGNIAIERYALQSRLDELQQEETDAINMFLQLREQESALLEQMRERYGEGQIDISAGTFTPDSGLEK